MMRDFALALLMLYAMQGHCARVKVNEILDSLDGKTQDVGPSKETPLPEESFFGGLILESAPEVWARNVDDDHWTTIGAEVGGITVFDALYNHVNSVSDIVSYEIGLEDFKVGGGRGSGWKEDEQLKLAYGGKRTEYATRTDYGGVGHFKIDRGHQCPVGSFNSKLEKADKTNMPSNLSPQSVELNQKKWRFLEAEIRNKAKSDHLQMEDGSPMYAEVLTGPLYQLPEAFFVSGKDGIEAGKEMWERQIDSWCKDENGTIDDHPWLQGEREQYKSTIAGKKAWIECAKIDSEQGKEANNLWMEFHAKPKATSLRIPLGYFKIIVIPAGTRADKNQHQYCAFMMDQTGQCMLTNMESIASVAHMDFSNTELMKEPHRLSSPYFCMPPGGTLREKNSCAYFHKKDIHEVTAADVLRWRKAEEASKKKKK